MTPFLEPGQIIVSATKGIEDGPKLPAHDAGHRASVRVRKRAPSAALRSAQEVAAGAPTAITVAAAESEIANRLQEELSSPGLRIYTNDDVIGVELGGDFKNVIAIASGIASGLGLGHNSVAAIITRGVAEYHAPGGGLRRAKGIAGRSFRSR